MALFVNFFDIISTLGNMGFFTFVLPFLLFLIIIDAILMGAKPMFGLDARKSAILSAVISLFIINFTPVGITLGQFLTEFFGTMSMYLTAVLVFILFIGMGGWKLDDIPGGKQAYILGFFLITVIIFANVSPGGIPFLSSLTSQDLTMIFILALVVGVIYLLSYEKPSTPAKP